MFANSPLDAWNIAAKTITSASPRAAQTVKKGFQRSNDGSNKPIPPANSLIPINRTKLAGVPVTHGKDSANASIGCEDFINPAIKNIIPSKPCAIQSVMCIALLFFVLVFSVISFTVLIRLMQSCNYTV
mgnify:CR=1 FL=1